MYIVHGLVLLLECNQCVGVARMECVHQIRLYLFCSWPDLKPLHSINAHPANCICIEFDPTGKYAWQSS